VGHDVEHEAEAASPLMGGKFGKLLRYHVQRSASSQIIAENDSINDVTNIE
jgi:hypothetical protein